MPSNSAAWLNEKKELEVKSAPYNKPSKGQIVIKNAAVGINPVDWMFPFVGHIIFRWIKPPVILGTDCAGEVVEVGPDVTKFKVGDRVVGLAGGQHKPLVASQNAMGAFQSYVVLLEHMTAAIPSMLSFEKAAVIPLGLATAAVGMFADEQLNMRLPSKDTNRDSKQQPETVLIWGGSTSVGCNAIQLAAAAGYNVITTCSPRNFELVKRLGATHAFDYNSPTAVKDIISAFGSTASAGALAIGPHSTDTCVEILSKVKGKRFVSVASAPLSPDELVRSSLPKMMFTMVSSNLSTAVTSMIKGVKCQFFTADTLISSGLGKKVFGEWLEGALRDGSMVAAPEAMVVGKGLESVQKGFDEQRKGVSARKIVVAL